MVGGSAFVVPESHVPIPHAFYIAILAASVIWISPPGIHSVAAESMTAADTSTTAEFSVISKV